MKNSFSLAAALFALQCLAGPRLSPDRVVKDIKTKGLRYDLENLNRIGQENDGNRAFGLPGFNASMDFILERTEKFCKDMDTSIQSFIYPFEQTRNISVAGPDGEDVYVITLIYNPATPVPAGITAPLIDTPVNDETGSGCLEEDWEGIDATGKLALVKRGLCAISDKLKLARAHGALGVLLYNQDPGTDYGSATLGAENRYDVLPVGVIPLEVGTEWKERLAAGEVLEVNLLVDSILEDRETWNIISETKEGDPDNVIMLGAHLDSVQAGPGVNDDGSGTAALLEIMSSFRKYRGFKNKVRFAWWGAEEVGLAGSLFYTNNLTSEEADKIRYYFNYDMIGSPAPVYVVYDGEEIGTTKLLDYIAAYGKNSTLGSFGSSSDYVGFLQLGIPSSGIFTGAGAPEDPCYHLACDDIDNIDWEAITINAKAAARVAADFALSLEGIPRRNATEASTTPNRKRDLAVAEWGSLLATSAAGKPCSHEHEHDTMV
ncbi:hypothetical protein MKZ38_010066 [Zalerion maritima]|uniref:Peptide hydrolase n=1 Tax=Zalerion maritima TaxID=339359 RepID=A0AAD5RUJ0_9PEZI|nr:hypothetical protein MKZ38_010066 [Zalerion maritima]